MPTHYPRIKEINSKGPGVLRNLPPIVPMTVAQFAKAAKNGAQILDTRDMIAFGAGHVTGAMNINARPELSVWSGWLLDPDRPIHLVLEDDSELPRVLKLLWRTGFTDFGGYLVGGMAAWREEGRPFVQIPQISVHELRDEGDMIPLDVRKPVEWQAGHMPGATHAFLGELRGSMDKLDRTAPYAAYCASGFRASITASLLAANGFDDIRNVPGSWKAWTAAGYPAETPCK